MKDLDQIAEDINDLKSRVGNAKSNLQKLMVNWDRSEIADKDKVVPIPPSLMPEIKQILIGYYQRVIDSQDEEIKKIFGL